MLVVSGLLYVVCGMWSVVCCVLCVVCRLLFVVTEGFYARYGTFVHSVHNILLMTHDRYLSKISFNRDAGQMN